MVYLQMLKIFIQVLETPKKTNKQKNKKNNKKNKCKIIGSSLKYTLSTSNLNQTKAKLIIEQYNTEVNYWVVYRY